MEEGGMDGALSLGLGAAWAFSWRRDQRRRHLSNMQSLTSDTRKVSMIYSTEISVLSLAGTVDNVMVDGDPSPSCRVLLYSGAAATCRCDGIT